MNIRSQGAAALSLFVAACSSASLETRLSRAPVVLEERGVRVHVDTCVEEDRWRVGGALVESDDVGLQALRVSVFEDLDGDGQPSESEQRGSWRIDTVVPSRRLLVSGHIESRLAEGDTARYRLRSVVELEGGATLESTVPLAAR